MFDPNNFTLSLMFSFQKVWPILEKLCILLISTFHMFIHFLDWIGSQLGYLFKTTYFFSKPSSGCRL